MSKFSYSKYPLSDGYIDNWLIAGPQVIPVGNLAHFDAKNLHAEILGQYYEVSSGITQQPVEPGNLGDGRFNISQADTKYPFESQWNYMQCLEDHFVDLSTYYRSCNYLRSWAYVEIASPAEVDVTLTLTTNGPADVWLNDTHVHRQDHYYPHQPYSVSFTGHFTEGNNRVLVRFENAASRNCVYVMALKVTNDSTEKTRFGVRIPTAIESVDRRNQFESIFNAAYIDRDVFSRHEHIKVQWPASFASLSNITAQLMTPAGRTYAKYDKTEDDGAQIDFGPAYEFPGSAYDIVLTPSFPEYFDDLVRIKRKLTTWGVGNNQYSEALYGTFDERRKNALISAVRHECGVFSELAKMAVGWWEYLEISLLLDTIEAVNNRCDRSDLDMMGLLTIVYRFGDDSRMPEELKQPLEDCILNFKYWNDEPGSDIMCYQSESHRILFHACEILAGQLYPERTFTNNGQTGKWHQEHGEGLAIAWMYERGTKGFTEWTSDCTYEETLVALSHLADLAETGPVWEIASILIDKILFSIAINSYQGVFGSTHGRTDAKFAKGGYLAGISGITNLLWGIGIFNKQIMGTVSMALMKNYELPVMLQQIAGDLPEELWNREHHAPEDAFCTSGSGVNTVTYKTPDYMLSSAQDYRPGEAGEQQHIWQATLGPGATVFVNHPGSAGESDTRPASYWGGNRVLPRVAQWKDTLIAIHKLPENDWMGFTHAYFPIHAFDEYVIKKDAKGRSWAFAQKGDGYLALTASNNFMFLPAGPTAYRELRAPGSNTIWFCHMGRASLDGDFATFQDSILALDVTFDDLSIQATTLREDTLSFGWEGAFQRNGEDVPLDNFKHFDSSYCVADFPCEQMDIRFGDVAMRLQFGDETATP